MSAMMEQALRKRSTSRLMSDLDAARRRECECDWWYGFECGKHQRVALLEALLEERRPSPTTEGPEE